jgi:hypothetical protein
MIPLDPKEKSPKWEFSWTLWNDVEWLIPMKRTRPKLMNPIWTPLWNWNLFKIVCFLLLWLLLPGSPVNAVPIE